MIVIIDYGMGNLRSVLKKFERLRIPAKISSSIKEIQKAEKLILPGVGHFGQGMNNIKKLKLDRVLNKKIIEDKTPLLGICLGMQLLSDFSQEGNSKGFGWIKGNVRKFDSKGELRVPHIGWNEILIKKDCPLLKDIDSTKRFYFVHSYYFECDNKNNVVAQTEYGINFDSVIEKGNIYGIQFHPEKSHLEGLKFFQNFANL